MEKTGRKPIEIPIDKVQALAAQGLTEEQIYHVLGISHQTFYKYKRKNSELVEAIIDWGIVGKNYTVECKILFAHPSPQSY